MQLAPHDFWQSIYPAGTFPENPDQGFHDLYPATLPDGRQIALPIRALPGGTDRAVASLIVNQASFAVEDALADAMAGLALGHAPDVVVGVPTLGLPLANAVARRLGHKRMVALGTSRKFWYEEALSEPLSSITSPAAGSGTGKTLYLDPRLIPVLHGKRVLVVDDVVSTGASMISVLRLLRKAGVEPVAAVVAMKQTRRWRTALTETGFDLPVGGAVQTPLLARERDGWRADRGA